MHSRLLPALVTLGTLTACGGERIVAPPDDGRALDLTLSSPNGDDGAVLLRITGAAVDSVSAAPGGEAMRVEGTPAGIAEFVVTGNPLRGVIGRAWFAEAVRTGQVQVTVLEAASNSTFEVRDVASYRVAPAVTSVEAVRDR